MRDSLKTTPTSAATLVGLMLGALVLLAPALAAAQCGGWDAAGDADVYELLVWNDTSHMSTLR